MKTTFTSSKVLRKALLTWEVWWLPLRHVWSKFSDGKTGMESVEWMVEPWTLCAATFVVQWCRISVLVFGKPFSSARKWSFCQYPVRRGQKRAPVASFSSSSQSIESLLSVSNLQLDQLQDSRGWRMHVFGQWNYCHGCRRQSACWFLRVPKVHQIDSSERCLEQESAAFPGYAIWHHARVILFSSDWTKDLCQRPKGARHMHPIVFRLLSLSLEQAISYMFMWSVCTRAVRRVWIVIQLALVVVCSSQMTPRRGNFIAFRKSVLVK